MGEVYRARDTRLDRSVALKVISSLETAAPEQRERFRREARAIAKLSHPHICTLHDVGEDGGVAFLVMEHLEGETLAERMDAGALPVEEALRIGVEVAEALDRAHREGIVHRDLKPGNVMLTRHGAKVLDFGLAKLREAADAERGESAATVSLNLSLTEDGRIVGTLPYMAPEQLEGRDTDARTDIFSLGIVLHEMVTGARPFQGTSRAGLIAAILTAEPPPLSSLQPKAPAALERVVKRCLAKDSDERWQSARDLAAELRWIAEPGSQASAPQSASARRRTGLAWLVGGLALAAPLAWMIAHRPKAAEPLLPRWQWLTFRRGTLSSARFAPDGQTVVYSAAWDGKPYEVFSARVGSIDSRPLGLRDARILGISSTGEMALTVGPQRFNGGMGTLIRVPLAGGAPRELLENVRGADWMREGGEPVVVRRVKARDQVEFPAGKTLHEVAFASFPRVSPDGERLAFLGGPAQGTGDVIVGDRSGKVTVLSRDWQFVFGLAWSPRGDEIWFSASKGDIAPALYAVSLSGKERLMLQAPEALSLQDVSRDGRALVLSIKSRGHLACLPPGEKEERELGWHDFSFVEDVSADGRTVLFTETQGGGAPNGAVYVRGTDGSPAVRLGDGRAEGLSPDGSRALARTRSAQAPRFVLLPTHAGSPRVLPPPPVESIVEADWIDDRRIVFSGRQKGKPQRVYVQDVEDGSIRPLTPEGVLLLPNSPTPDGRFVTAFAGGKPVLYPVEGGEPSPIAHLTEEDTPLQWSADGRHLFVSRGGPAKVEIQRVDVTSGARKPWRVLSPPDPAGVERLTPIVLTPDGSAHCYTYARTLSDLFVVEGLR
jgi:hypothetical protein